ncbi:MAG: LPS export ABC transporter periplasmic protein LptC [Saprospiraceae bacterium]|nr:LPS export ABC transporter periplasmic protein LptC [Saprospiraceae bacterium]
MIHIRYLLFVGIALILFRCTEESTTAEDDNFVFDVNIETAKDVEIIYSDSALVRVKIKGPKMLYHVNTREPKQEFPEGVQVDFFGPDRQITSTLTGKYGIRQESKGMVVVQDSVVWQSTSGERLETEELIWDERKQQVYNHKFVVLRRGSELIYGHGFEATQDFKYAKVNASSGVKSVDETLKN